MQILKDGEISERFSLAPVYFAVYVLAVRLHGGEGAQQSPVAPQ